MYFPIFHTEGWGAKDPLSSRRRFIQSFPRYRKRRNPVCTRKEYASSVKPVYAGNGCAIFPVFDTEERAKKIRSPSRTIDLF